MKIVHNYPPNIDEIKKVLKPFEGAVFTYGSVVYAPHFDEKQTFPEHVMVHERVHERQQKDDPQQWWSQYLADPQFRLSQELEAYAEQYKYVKRLGMRYKEVRQVIWNFATDLSSEMYGNIISPQEAESKIRNLSKTI